MGPSPLTYNIPPLWSFVVKIVSSSGVCLVLPPDETQGRTPVEPCKGDAAPLLRCPIGRHRSHVAAAPGGSSDSLSHAVAGRLRFQPQQKLWEASRGLLSASAPGCAASQQLSLAPVPDHVALREPQPGWSEVAAVT